MPPTFLRLNGITTVERHEMINRMKTAIDRGGAVLIDFHMFSNAMIVLNVELPAGKVERFAAAVQATGLRLETRNQSDLAACVATVRQLDPKAPEVGLAGSIQITFIHDEPDLHIEVPAVPG